MSTTTTQTNATIEDVRSVSLEAPLDEPFGYAQSWVDTRSATLVRIEASDGTVGWGECWGPSAGNARVVDEILAPELVGEDPTRVEVLYDRCYDRCRATYQTFVPLSAVSGVELALWDLKGKLLDVPVYSLLGGDRREAVRAYATGHYFRPVDDIETQYESILEEAQRNADAVGAVKLKIGLNLLGYGPEEDVELVRRARETLGSDVTIMVDANYAYDRPTAMEVGRELSALDVNWFEEPIRAEDIEGYAQLREALDVKIAGGECHGPAEFDRLLDAGGVDVAQPDVCIVGGLTPTKRLVSHAESDGSVRVVPHVWGTPITLAASLHLISTIRTDTWLEFDRSPNPLREELSPRTFEADSSGEIPVPDGPGFGVEIDQQAIERYRV